MLISVCIVKFALPTKLILITVKGIGLHCHIAFYIRLWWLCTVQLLWLHSHVWPHIYRFFLNLQTYRFVILMYCERFCIERISSVFQVIPGNLSPVRIETEFRSHASLFKLYGCFLRRSPKSSDQLHEGFSEYAIVMNICFIEQIVKIIRK